MKKLEECTVGIAGLGIMGGAFALALRRAGAGRILGCDTDSDTVSLALADGAVDGGFARAEEMLPRCDLVFLCINPRAAVRFMADYGGTFRPGAVVTDICGVKKTIVDAMEGHPRTDIEFIPGHPMAGSEKGGYREAVKCDFRGKNYILTPLARNRAGTIEFLKDIIYRLGFSRITLAKAEEHDRKIAFTSQLCHVIAAALIDCEEDTGIVRFGGGSFEDLTRIAMLNVPMWTELFLENRAELAARLDGFAESLAAFRGLIAAGDAESLAARLATVRDRRARMAAGLPLADPISAGTGGEGGH